MSRRGLLLLALTGCAALPETRECPPVLVGPHIWLSETLIHTEIGVRVSDLRGRLTELAWNFPGSEVLTFGFGKRHYFLSLQPRIFATLLAPIPGLGAMEVGGHAGPPPGALTLAVSAEGLGRLLAALEGSFRSDLTPLTAQAGRQYFAASRLYTLAYTCNTWTAEMLATAGLPVRSGLVVTPRGVMTQAVGGCREPLIGRRSLRV